METFLVITLLVVVAIVIFFYCLGLNLGGRNAGREFNKYHIEQLEQALLHAANTLKKERASFNFEHMTTDKYHAAIEMQNANMKGLYEEIINLRGDVFALQTILLDLMDDNDARDEIEFNAIGELHTKVIGYGEDYEKQMEESNRQLELDTERRKDRYKSAVLRAKRERDKYILSLLKEGGEE